MLSVFVQMYNGDSQCEGGENFPLHPCRVLMAVLIIKLAQDRVTGEKETRLIHVHRGLINIGPKKWPKEAILYFFRQRKNKFERNCQDKET